jgi:hypothetical protein
MIWNQLLSVLYSYQKYELRKVRGFHKNDGY